MKKHNYILIFLLLMEISCRDNCDSDPIRPAISDTGLNWVKVINSKPDFKITLRKSNGEIIIDTLKGEYALTINEGPQAQDECEEFIKYKVYVNALSLPYSTSNYGMSLHLDNFLESGYRVKIYTDTYIDETSVLDTAYVNGKLYENVFKDASPSYSYCYSKGVGFISLKKTEELITGELYTIELIP